MPSKLQRKLWLLCINVQLRSTSSPTSVTENNYTNTVDVLITISSLRMLIMLFSGV